MNKKILFSLAIVAAFGSMQAGGEKPQDVEPDDQTSKFETAKQCATQAFEVLKSEFGKAKDLCTKENFKAAGELLDPRLMRKKAQANMKGESLSSFKRFQNLISTGQSAEDFIGDNYLLGDTDNYDDEDEDDSTAAKLEDKHQLKVLKGYLLHNLGTNRYSVALLAVESYVAYKVLKKIYSSFFKKKKKEKIKVSFDSATTVMAD